MWLGVLETCIIKVGQNPHDGALLVETWRTVSGSNLPHAFQVSTCRASPIYASSHPSLEQKGACWKGSARRGKPPPVWKASARRCLVSPLSILSAFVYTERLRQRVGRYQRTGLTPHQSERLKFCFVLVSVNSSFVSHRSFTAPMLHLRCVEEISAAAIL